MIGFLILTICQVFFITTILYKLFQKSLWYRLRDNIKIIYIIKRKLYEIYLQTY
jgi:hypothetical protein